MTGGHGYKQIVLQKEQYNQEEASVDEDLLDKNLMSVASS